MKFEKTGNTIVDLSFEFSLKIVAFAEQLESERKFVIANQLLKSGTSIGANISEAQTGESREDFIHKLKIAAKEAKETIYWLRLCQCADSYPFDETLMDNILEIDKVLSCIIATARKNRPE